MDEDFVRAGPGDQKRVSPLDDGDLAVGFSDHAGAAKSRFARFVIDPQGDAITAVCEGSAMRKRASSACRPLLTNLKSQRSWAAAVSGPVAWHQVSKR